MDFIIGLPMSKGSTTILVVVDRLSKAAHFGSLPFSFTIVSIPNIFTNMVVKHHGFPLSIVSYKDSIFLSKFWQTLFPLSGTTLKYNSAYHPQTDGQTKVVNRCLEQYLRAFTHQNPYSWTKFLIWAELWYNTSYHSSTGMTHFQILYSKPPRNIQTFYPGSSSTEAVETELATREEILQQLKLSLYKAQKRMKQQAHKSRRDLSFQVGELVKFKLQPYK